MVSEKSRKTSDLRKVLPRIFGFPKKKHGPGKLLDPFLSTKQLEFAVQFGILVLNGENPVTARRDAYISVFDDTAADADDKTLMRWLFQNFDLKKAPKDAEQWKEVVYKFLLAFCYDRVMSNPASTSDDAQRLIDHLQDLSRQTKSRETLT